MRRIGIFFLGFFYLVSALEATTLTWNTDGDGDWAVNSNWIPENIPASADNVILGNIISEPSTINLPSSAQCGSLSFTSAQPYTMSDGSLEVFLGSIQVGLPARNHIINSNIKLVHDLTFLSDDPSSILTISGDISEVLQVSSDNNLGIPSSDIRFFGNGTLKSTGDITANRPITLPAGGQLGTLMIDGSTTFTAADTISGAGFLVKDGTGTLVLDVPNNTFTAPARLDDGILQISSDNQLGTSGSLTLNGGTLRATENILSNRVITLLKPTLIDIVTARDLEFANTIQGDGSITKIGGGTLILFGVNNYTGGTTLTEGYIFFFNSSNFGTQGLIMDGGTLLPDNTSSDLLIEILSTGTLETSAPYTATGVISGNGSLTIQGVGPTTLFATNTYKGGTKINVTEVIVTSDSNLGDPLGPLNLDNGTLHVVTTPNLTTNRNITLANTATLETDAGVALQLSGKLDGTGKLVKTGDGALNLGVFSHEYSGGTKLSAGILEIGATGNFGTGQVEFAGGELSTIFDTQINVGATVSAPTTISANNGATLTWAGPIDGSAALTYDGPGTLFLTNNNSYSGPVTVSSGTLALTAPAINSGITNHSIVTFNDDSSGTFLGNISGTGIVKKEGTGTITLFNVNTYSGATQFNEGTLKISATNQLGPNTLVFDGGTLGTSVTLVDTHDITLSSKGSFVVPLGLALTLNGSINGGGTLINPGPGGLIINASNTYTGGTQLTGGLIQIGDSLSLGTGSITVDDGTLFTSTNIALDNLFTLNGNSYFEVVSDTLTLKSNISGDGTLIKTQLGTLNLGSTAKDYTGGTQINTGTVIINMSDNLGTGPVSINNATLNSTGTFPVSNPFTLVNNTTFDVDSGQTLSLTGTIEGNGTLVKIGDGTLNLGSSAHTYSGGTTLTTGILQINSAESLGAGDIDFNGGDLIAVGNFTIEANAALNAPSTITTSDTLTWNGIISGGSTLKKDGSGTLILFGDNSYSGGTTITAGTLTGTTDGIQGNILNNTTLIFDQTSPGSYNDVISGPGQVIKEGPGTVILTNNNLYLGDTLFNNGAFQISTNTQLGPGTFKFNGGFLQTTADIIDSHSITLNTNGVFSTNNSTTLTLNGSIDGGGTLTKVGSGTLDLGAAAHTYSGGTFINDGTLRINVDNTLGTGPVSFFGGTLQSTADIGIALSTAFDADAIISTNSGTTLTWGGTLSGSKRLFKEGDGTLILTANNTNSGGITISSGTLEGTTNSIKGDIANNSTLNFNQTITGTYSGVISGGGSVDVTGPGTVTLEGANTYSGGTTITNGILIGDAESLQGSIANGSALVFDQVFEEVFNGTISGTGSITKKGFGSLFITSDQPFTGLLTINEGAIDLSSTLSGDVFVSNGGHFTGNGQVNDLTNEGIVSIRPKISSSNVLGTYIQKPSGNLVIELNDLGANDMLNIVGNASLDGTLNVALLPGIYEGGTLYTLLTAANVTPGFTNIISRVPGDLFLNYFPTYV